MTQVIFLDFDGVLHPKMNDSFEFMGNFFAVLNNFRQAQVVISSNWKDGLTQDNLNDLFKEYAHRVVGKTTSSQGMSRQDEIMAYVKLHKVTCYVAIDDDCRDTLFALDCDFLFKTNYFKGLTNDILPGLIQFMRHRGFTEF
jgi:hypothetical protein